MPCKTENMPFAVNGSSSGRGVTDDLFFACPFVRSTVCLGTIPCLFADAFPNRFPGVRIECHHAGIRLPPHENNQQITFQNGRAADSEEPEGLTGFLIGEIEFFEAVTHPDFFPGDEIETEQLAFGSEGVAAILRQKRCAAGTVVVTERIPEIT